jgi:hypothetical protein
VKDFFIGLGLLGGALLVGVVIIASIFGGGYLKAFYNRTVGVEVESSITDRQRQSLQYISSVETRLHDLVQAYHETDDPAQKAALRQQMITWADRIPEDRVPSSAAAIIFGGTE